MLFRLRHKRFPVLDLIIKMGTKDGFTVEKTTKTYDRDLLPLELRNVKEEHLADAFDKWYTRRLISEDSPAIARIAYLMSETGGLKIKNPCAFIKSVSLLSYGRSLTDKYWLAPVRDTLFTTGIKGCNLNGRTILKKDSYLNMDLTKNGFAHSFASIMKNDNQPAHFDFNIPDLCTPGKKKKFAVRDNLGTIWIEKESDQYEKARACHKDAPTIFPTVRPAEHGYQTKLLTSSNREIIPLKEIILASRSPYEKQAPVTIDDVAPAMEHFLHDPLKYEEDMSHARNLIDDDAKFIENSGFMCHTNTKEILGFKAWI